MKNFACLFKPDKKEYFNLGEEFTYLNFNALSAYFKCPKVRDLLYILNKGRIKHPYHVRVE